MGGLFPQTFKQSMVQFSRGQASNYFMPKCTLSDKGPGGGGWIHFNKYLQALNAGSRAFSRGALKGPIFGPMKGLFSRGCTATWMFNQCQVISK